MSVAYDLFADTGNNYSLFRIFRLESPRIAGFSENWLNGIDFYCFMEILVSLWSGAIVG
jgi:hypothetical protein